MSNPLSADRLVRVLRDEGLHVVEYKSWRTHNRNHKGPWGPVHGVMIHHTVTSGTQRSVDICYDGYSSLPGPLCLGVIAKDGTVYLVGNGRANHAGLGDDDVLRAVIAEKAPPAPNERNTDGNARFYGFECVNLGDGEDPWPEAQLTAIEKASAAICRAHGWGKRSVIGHKEWTDTKIDPRGFSMDGMRDRVDRRLGSATLPQEDDMLPAYLSLGFTRDVTLQPGAWVPLAWEHEFGDGLGEHPQGGQTFIAGKGRFTGTLYLRGEGIAKGQELQVRLVEDDASGKTVTRHPIVEVLGTDGGSFGGVSVTGYVGTGRKAKLMVANCDSKAVKLTEGRLKALVWDA